MPQRLDLMNGIELPINRRRIMFHVGLTWDPVEIGGLAIIVFMYAQNGMLTFRGPYNIPWMLAANGSRFEVGCLTNGYRKAWRTLEHVQGLVGLGLSILGYRE